MTFRLKYSEVLQGSFQPGALNLMMVFQVNCPGCFLHGFPQMIRLQSKYHDKLSCFALSTAFEDFEFNTAENTKRLIEENHLTGETGKVFDANNLIWNEAISFPVLIDAMIVREEILHPQFIDKIISNHPQFGSVSQPEIAEIKTSLQRYFNNYQKCGFTFASNLLQGTPTFILFNGSMEILLQWFGHIDSEKIDGKLNENIQPK
jgi:hypothetical protein